MKTMKQIETWARDKLAPVLLKKYQDGDYDHLGVNGAEGKCDYEYWCEIQLENVLDVKEKNALRINLMPGGAYDAGLTIHLWRQPKKIYTYCCKLKHHITGQDYTYYPAPEQKFIDAVLNGLHDSIIQVKSVKADDMWNTESRAIDGGIVSMNIRVGNKELRKIIHAKK